MMREPLLSQLEGYALALLSQLRGLQDFDVQLSNRAIELFMYLSEIAVKDKRICE